MDAFAVVDAMIRDGKKNLFQIYEWLRASQPDIGCIMLTSRNSTLNSRRLETIRDVN